jgi:hypothetical protein
MYNPTWKFPPLDNVEAIKQFNGDPESLDDFTTSVDAFIFSRDLPLAQGGWVQPDGDGGWEYPPLPASDEAGVATGMKKNYYYGMRFCVMLAERFTGLARDWWVTTGRKTTFNCWRSAPPGYCPPNVVEHAFITMLHEQFQYSRPQEHALLKLETLKWNIFQETPTAFRIRVTCLFAKAGINDFNAKRAFILGVLSVDMRRQVKRPITEPDLWNKIEEAVVTEESIRATRDKHREGKIL